MPCRSALAVVAGLAAALTLAGCSGGGAPAASTPTATATSTLTAAASQAAAVSSAAALGECSGADNGVKIGFEAWETLMKSDTGFLKWAGDTASIESTVSSAASTDSTFGDTANAAAATALVGTLIKVESDLTQGDQTGEAPASYPADVKAAIAAETPFEACG